MYIIKTSVYCSGFYFALMNSPEKKGKLLTLNISGTHVIELALCCIYSH